MNPASAQIMTPHARRLAGVAGASVVAFAVAIWMLAGQSDGNEPPDLISRAVASAVLLGAPGLIGLIGAATGRRSVLIAAGIACLFQSAISFSGVTLVYLVPAILFLRSATDQGASPRSEPIRPLRVVLAAVAAVPIALIVVLNVGLLGVVLLALVAGVAASRRRSGPRLRVSGGEAARGAAIVLLVIGAWAATIVLAETACWVAHGSPGGGVTWERIPPTNELTLEPGDVSAGCAGGTITPFGAAVAGGLLLLAIGVAALPNRRSRRVGDPIATGVAGA